MKNLTSARGKTMLDAIFSLSVVAISIVVVYLAFTLVPKSDPAPAPFPGVGSALKQVHLGLVRGSTKAFALDQVSVAGKSVLTGPRGGVAATPTVSRGDAFVVSGWAVDSVTNLAASDVVAQVGIEQTIAPVAISRPDVDALLHLPPNSDAGFSMTVPTSDLEPGPHVLRFFIVGSDGLTLRDTNRSIAFRASASRSPLHPVVTLDSLDGRAIDTTAHPVHVGTGAWIVKGWAAADVAADVPFVELYAYIDGKKVVTVRGEPRPDVAVFLRAPSLANAGFTATFDHAPAPGEHTLTVSLEAPDGRITQSNLSLSIAR